MPHSRCLLLSLLATALATKVKVLTADNFKETIEGNANVLVEFYAPWCGHCKRLAPEYDAASLKLKDEDVVLGKVDATEHSELAQQFEVRGYPTLIWFKNGKSKEYDGGRTQDTIVSWVKKKIGPVLTLLEDADAIEKFKASAPAVVIAKISDEDIASLKAVAEDSDSPVAYITDAKVAEEAGVDGVVVFKTFDEKKVVYDGEMEVKALAAFVSGESIPLVMTWKDNQEMMGKLEAPLFFACHTPDDLESVTEVVRKAAFGFKGKFLFYTVDASHAPNKRLLEFFDLSAGQTVVFNQKDRKKFFFKEGDLSAFLQSVIDGKAEPTYKSEEIPESQEGPVHVLVGKEFDKIVKDSTKDVLVEFYAPWCGHCKKLAPVYDKLGEHYAKDDSVIIAKMDATANEVPEPEVRGFPTIYFFPADNKEGVKYEGGRELEDFIEYIDENATGAKTAKVESSDKAEGHDEL
ncbi:hypothetical protein AAMO2058_000172100 [Amorphochlora amoebiformis]